MMNRLAAHLDAIVVTLGRVLLGLVGGYADDPGESAGEEEAAWR
ncbi:hypothetical protein ACFC1I_19015 [Microbacterium sp. NPDC056044]